MHSTIRISSFIYFLLIIIITACSAQSNEQAKHEEPKETFYHNHLISVGAEQLDDYLPLLSGKAVGLVVNQTSMVNDKHLVDVLLKENINVKNIFVPEHGFRGTADAGQQIKNGVDEITGLPIISLYGDNKKPKLEQIEETEKYKEDIEGGVSRIDIMVFDLQDVGARFYTYISTMHYVMEACAEAKIPLIILDRPNPNGFYVDGPVMEDEFKSFVGLHNVPIVHGMTVGEYALMINGEAWLKNGVECDLTVIPCKGYDHTRFYKLPVKPSPNLPNMRAIYLYPTLCLFEGTDISVGRGTDKQFQVIGSPQLSDKRLDMDYNGLQANYKFTPQSMSGATKPKHEGVECIGIDLSEKDVELIRDIKKVDIQYIKGIYKLHQQKEKFFNPFFTKLAGNSSLSALISDDLSVNPDTILSKYNNDLQKFKEIRKKYLLYKDFE
ncbi:MAG: DUF1343 domain-containing protein [Chitinophagales bacterium]